MGKKSKKMKKILFFALVSILLGTVSCGEDDPIEDTFYTVAFDADGGTPAPEAQRVKEGDKIKAPSANPAKEGYVFLFWHLNGASTAYNFSTPVNSNITLQAKWEEESKVEYWQVTWELNGGAWSSDDNHATQVVKSGTLAEPAAPTKAGNTFDGWYKDATLANKINFPYDVSTVTSNFTLYAKWTNSSTGDKMFTSISELKSWLASQPDNTDATPYKVGLKNVNLDVGNNWGNLGVAVKGSKYIDLDLQSCAGTAIPDGYYEREVNGSQIKYTYFGVFLGLENLVAITFPKGLKTIGKYAFYECENLHSVFLDQGLTEIHDEAFRYCSALKNINLQEGLNSIGEYAFQYCALTNFPPLRSLKKIGLYAFSSCKFTTITIPGYMSDANFGHGVFNYCKSLKSVVLEEGIETLWANMFTDCASLESVTLPQSLKTIEQAVFEFCYSLRFIEIPAGVTSIGASAFRDLFIYESSVVKMNPLVPPTLGYQPFTTISYASLVIKVPATSLNAYKTATGWKDYASKIVANTN